MDVLEITLKLLLAVGLGGLIGLERESSHKPAGFRTNILICLGATMMMVLSTLLLGQENARTSDLTRIAAGVITGIGFIGAGTIIHARGMVIGLTTAATIWVVSGLGLVIGAGYYLIALIYAGIVILTLIIFRQFEEHYLKKNQFTYILKTKPLPQILSKLRQVAFHEGIKFSEIALKKENQLQMIKLSFNTSEEKEHQFNQSILQLEGIEEISIV
jgi:putative Mg2+ transporter-C (MgtC) family protein